MITGWANPAASAASRRWPRDHAEGIAERVASTTRSHLPSADAVTIQLGPPHHLRVRAVRDGGEVLPVAGARVTLVNGNPKLDRRILLGISRRVVERDDPGPDRRIRDGRPARAGLQRGDGAGPGARIRPPPRGLARRPRRDGVALQPEAVLTGEVRDADGTPLNDGFVIIAGSSGDRLVSSIDAGRPGRFRLGQLPPGEYTLTVNLDGSERHHERVTLQPGQVLDRTIRLTGRTQTGPARGRASPVEVIFIAAACAGRASTRLIRPPGHIMISRRVAASRGPLVSS